MKEKRDWFYKLTGIGIFITGVFLVLISLTFNEIYIWLPIGFGGTLLIIIGALVFAMKNPELR